MQRSLALTAVRVAAAAILALTAAIATADEPANNEDAETLSALEELGVKPGEELLLEFAFHFPSLADARRANDKLAALGFRRRLEPGGGAGDYLILARKQVKLDLPTLTALRSQLQALAQAEHGEYEGWGIP